MSFDVVSNRSAAIYHRGQTRLLDRTSHPSRTISFVEFHNMAWCEVVMINQSLAVAHHIGHSKTRDFGKREWQDWHTGSIVSGPGFERRGESTGASRVWLAHISPDFVETVLERPIEMAKIRTIRDPTRDLRIVQHLLAALREEILLGSPNGLLFGESIATALIAATTECASTQTVFGSLPVNAVSRLPDFIDAHLHEDLNLSRLAEVADVSVRQFTDAFRKTFGQSAYQYVLERRVARAAALIRLGMLFADVAGMVGIDSGTVLARAFRKVAGITPTDVRRGFVVRLPDRS